MAQLADIIVKAMLPLHPRLAASSQLSIQLVSRGIALDEIQATTRDKDGVWEATSTLDLPDDDQPLTLAVVVEEQNNKTCLVSPAFTATNFLTEADEELDGCYGFIASDSGAQIRVNISSHFRSNAATNLDNSISSLRRAVNLGSDHPQQVRRLDDLSNALKERYECSGNRADIDEAIQASQNALSLSRRDAPERVDFLMQLASNYVSRFKGLGDMADIDTAISTYSEGLALIPEESHDRVTGHLHNFAFALLQRVESLGKLEDLERAIFNLESAVTHTPDGHPQRRLLYHDLGAALQYRFDLLNNLPDLERAISNLESALKLAPDGHPDKPSHYTKLGTALECRFEYLGNLADLNKAIFNQENAVTLTSDGHPDKPSWYRNLGIALNSRFNRLGNLIELERAIFNWEKAVSHTPDGHPDEPACYNSLGNGLLSQFMRLGNLTDLTNAITNLENAVRLTHDGHPDKSLYYNSVGVAFESRFRWLGNLSDLNNSISNLESAVKLTPDGHVDKPSRYNNLGKALQCRFEHLDNLTDLEMAMFSLEKAVSLTPNGHPNKSSRYTNLGITLQSRFKRLGNLADINNAILNQECAIKLTPDGHPDKPACYSNLGSSFRSRFWRLADPADLDKAISNQENSVRLTPNGHPDKPSRYNNLGNALLSRFHRLGNLPDLNKAISNQDEAVRLTPKGHTEKPGRYSNLGSSFLSRFERLGDIADLNKAIFNLEIAVRLKPDGHSDKTSRYNNLGNALLSRFHRLGNLADLNNAILNQENAVGLTPDGHPDRPTRYNNLGISLHFRFKRLGGLADLNAAISNLENAVRLTPDGHADKPSFYSCLVAPLNSRFERLGDLADLNKAISNQETALSVRPDGHPEKASMTVNLALCYERRFESSGKVSDLNLAHSLYATAAQYLAGYPLQRFKAAFKWAHCAKLMKISPLPAYKYAIGQLPRIAWLGIPVNEQHSSLEEIGGTVREAVAAAVEVKEYKLAVEWMEQGRSIVWQNLLRLRAPVDDLRVAHSELADKLHSISEQLHPTISRKLRPETRQPEEIAESHISLAIEWDETLDQVRKLPNFKSFLKPKFFDTLSLTAHEGPVVVLNVAPDRCDALALIPGSNGGISIVSIPLTSFSLNQSVKLFLKLATLLRQVGVRDRGTRKPTNQPRRIVTQKEFKSILYTLWVAVVKPVLDGLAYQPQSSDLPRIWWCATGPLALLPIHAAGDYDATEVGQKLSDYAVSSYTPTLAAILDSSYPVISDNFKLLTVAQPSAPGYSTIPKTVEEVKQIVKVATGVSVITLAKEAATVEQVQKEMRESHWVHLACHGKQDASKPIESGLILYDGTLELSTIIKESLPNADFAFLSACQTATGDHKVIEESAHLAAGMLLAGYRGVIATMWSIKDDDAPQVTDVVYKRMLKDGKPNRREAAYALHDAVKQLRDSGADFASWVPFIHIGR